MKLYKYFSTNNIRYPKVNLKKSKIITEEFDKYYIEDKDNLDLSIKFLKNNNYKIINNNNIEFIRNIRDWNIKISFKCPFSYDDEDIENKISEEIDLDEEYIPIIIILKRRNKENSIFINAEINNSELYVKEINSISNIEKYYESFFKCFNHKNEVKLFDFGMFDDELQSRFMNFLNELEINQTLIDVIETLSYNKDKNLFYNWLKTLEDEIKNI